ncbi:MAG: Beta-lactamase superfamily domain protein [Firmicutes bacterium ADurb.Bin182]|nr:MAG: Beta-lactamase superfamily domain protein [Firmicutes bacterium ADurb.Bin182]
MKVRRTGNSGFAVDIDGDLLIFDCYNPESNPWLFDRAKNAKRVTMFVSHSHRDHYSPKIARFSNVCSPCFVLSDDVSKLSGSKPVKSGDSLCVNGLDILVFGSTDIGVSFYVRHPAASLFHAGDLNNWHWMDESEPYEVEKAEKDFMTIIKDIAEKAGRIGAAFFPADPRMGTDFYKGAVQFARLLRPDVLIPMHFRESFELPESFFKETGEYTRILMPEKNTWTEITGGEKL